MVTAFVSEGNGWAAVGEMVCGPSPGIAKVMRSGPALVFASRRACCSEPAPVTFVLVTVNVAAETKPMLPNRKARGWRIFIIAGRCGKVCLVGLLFQQG